MRVLFIIALTVTLAHGKIVPLHHIKNIQQVQSEIASSIPKDGTPVTKNKDQSIAISTGTVGCGTLSDNTQRKARHLLKEKHTKDNLKNTYQDKSRVHEDFTCICPDASVFSPCTCDCAAENGEGLIDCSGIPDVNQLKIKFQTTHFPVNRYGMFYYKGYNQLISTSNSEVPSLPENVFNEVAFKKIYFTFGVFQSVHPEAFISSFDTLEALYLTCSEHLIYFPELMEFPYLNTLGLSSNAIELIPVISPQPSVENLWIDQNRIKNITPYAFKNLPMLQELDLAQNQLTSLEKNTMHLISDIPWIYMDHNNINFVDDEAFSGDEKSQPGYLDLVSNNLSTLREPVFRKILELISSLMLDGGGVLVNDNPLDCSSLFWLMEEKELLKYISAPQCLTNTPTIR